MTSTSDDFDFARALTDAFVERRGRGSALSAADRHLADGWEADGVPLDVVLDGIDAAFERRRDAPRSLKDCKRWVTAAIKKWRASGSVVEGAGDFAASPSGAAPSTPADASAPTPPPQRSPAASDADATGRRILAVIAEARAATRHPGVRAGLDAVTDEVRGLIASGALDAAALHALDDVAAVAAHRAGGAADPSAAWPEQVRAARAALGDAAPRLVERVLSGTGPDSAL